jgi:hypothetical protein
MPLRTAQIADLPRIEEIYNATIPDRQATMKAAVYTAPEFWPTGVGAELLAHTIAAASHTCRSATSSLSFSATIAPALRGLAASAAGAGAGWRRSRSWTASSATC